MPKLDRIAYHNELRRVAKNLGLSARGDIQTIEAAIIRHCSGQLSAWIKAHGQPATLTELLNLFTASLDLEFVEIDDDAALDTLLKNIPPTLEPVMACIQSELDDATDAVTIKRIRCRPGDRRLLAVVNRRGWHALRVFFTKWHEAVHCILEGQQLRMAFRKTRVDRPEPEEVLVDRVAAELAYYPLIFGPAIEKELLSAGKLTFDGVNRVCEEVAPEASLTSTVIASLQYCSGPVWFVTCGLGYKRELERKLSSRQGRLLPAPTPQLRVRESWCGPAAIERHMTIHQNMRVPESSAIAQAFNDVWSSTVGKERLEAWETSSSGPVGYGDIEVEAFKRDDEVWALIRLIDDS